MTILFVRVVCPGWDSNGAPPEYNSESLHLEQILRAVFRSHGHWCVMSLPIPVLLSLKTYWNTVKFCFPNVAFVQHKNYMDVKMGTNTKENKR
jgi:hypothetical protein